jgi:hypothetical protein
VSVVENEVDLTRANGSASASRPGITVIDLAQPPSSTGS